MIKFTIPSEKVLVGKFAESSGKSVVDRCLVAVAAVFRGDVTLAPSKSDATKIRATNADGYVESCFALFVAAGLNAATEDDRTARSVVSQSTKLAKLILAESVAIHDALKFADVVAAVTAWVADRKISSVDMLYRQESAAKGEKAPSVPTDESVATYVLNMVGKYDTLSLEKIVTLLVGRDDI
jgi:hypothetical protein